MPPSLSLHTGTTATGAPPSAAARLKLTKGNLEKLGGASRPPAGRVPAAPAPPASAGFPAAAARGIPAQARAVPAAAAARHAAVAPGRGRGATAAARPRAERKARSWVLGAVFAFTVTGGTVAAMNYQGSVAEGRSIAAMQATLQVVHNEQANFRLLNQRFATWPELEAAGAKLAPSQKVLRANASASHWFMSIFDRETGAVCSQTGELFDEEAGERKASCRPREG